MLIGGETRATYTSAVGEKPGVVISRPLSGTRGLRDGTTATTSDAVCLLRWGPQVLHTRRREVSILVLLGAPWMPFWELVSEDTGRAAACAQVPDYRRLYTRSGRNSGDVFYAYDVNLFIFTLPRPLRPCYLQQTASSSWNGHKSYADGPCCDGTSFNAFDAQVIYAIGQCMPTCTAENARACHLTWKKHRDGLRGDDGRSCRFDSALTRRRTRTGTAVQTNHDARDRFARCC